MKTTRILVCDGSVDGIFTAVYQAYDMRYGHEFIKIVDGLNQEVGQNFELFSEYIEVPTDYEQSAKVGRTIRTKVSTEVYQVLVRAALSSDADRADLIYRYIILALHVGKEVVDYLSNDVVNKVHSLSRNVGLETHHYTGYVRFQEVEQGFLLSVIRPKNDIVALLADHFSDRLNNEEFCIADEGRRKAVIHTKNKEAVVIDLNEQEMEVLKDYQKKGEGYEELWKAFFHSVSIKERENRNLQRNNLPLRFRDHMVEFQ